MQSFKRLISAPLDSFFFFQAEDGIRDLTVTGVQTCALPISLRPISTEPVKKILLALDLASASPTAPPPWTTRTRPSGRPPFSKTRRIASPSSGVRLAEIGRASCRERVEVSVVAVSVTRNGSG